MKLLKKPGGYYDCPRCELEMTSVDGIHWCHCCGGLVPKKGNTFYIPIMSRDLKYFRNVGEDD